MAEMVEERPLAGAAPRPVVPLGELTTTRFLSEALPEVSGPDQPLAEAIALGKIPVPELMAYNAFVSWRAGHAEDARASG